MIGAGRILYGKLYATDFTSVVLLGSDFVLSGKGDTVLALESEVFGSVFLALAAYHLRSLSREDKTHKHLWSNCNSNTLI